VHLSAIRWLETAGLDGKSPPRKPAFSANSVLAMKYAIQGGIGVGLIPDYLSEDLTDLVPVLREVELPTVPIYFVLPEELKTAKKVQVFRDFLIAKARQWKY
jgi:DNA-binding transcriptional LysR family regulator